MIYFLLWAFVLKTELISSKDQSTLVISIVSSVLVFIFKNAVGVLACSFYLSPYIYVFVYRVLCAGFMVSTLVELLD
jgi:hypothetical protein